MLGLLSVPVFPPLPIVTGRVHSVIIPMVLQIGETIVLQRVELEEKASSLHFWIFGS
jgi:hypothetical protein